MFELAPLHKNFNETLLHKVASQPKALVAAKVTQEARKLYDLDRQVRCSLHRDIGFTRLKVNKHSILYAQIQPQHNTESLIAENFMKRFPLFVIVIASKRITAIASKTSGLIETKMPLNETLKELEKLLPVDPILENIEDFDDNIWTEFYSTQNIEQRRNLKLLYKVMPKKFFSSHDMHEEKRITEKTSSLKRFM